MISITYIDSRDGRVSEDRWVINSSMIIHMSEEDFKGHFSCTQIVLSGVPYPIRCLEPIDFILEIIKSGGE